MSDRDYRLPRSIRPIRYDLRIDVDIDAWRFRVDEAIEIHLDEATSSITLHALDLDVRSAEARVGERTIAATVSANAEAETVTLRFTEPLRAGAVRLEFEIHGQILERLRGFYRSTKDGARYAATQFEAADARRAFACFDEPEFKARFALTLVVPEELTAVSNGKVIGVRGLGAGRKEVQFAETPPISSYLVAYCVGPFEPTPTVETPGGWPVRVFLPRGMADKGMFARDAHAHSLTWLEAYTAIPYPYTKVDAIGVPDFEAGAMENPGAITYRLTAIAADEKRASTHALKGIYYTAAHELTHMWWGDLVTMAWWDDLWLNESFATFIGYKAVADLVPEWGLWRDFVATLARPFALDSLVSTHPISFEVKNAHQATERFDVITYWKGAGVVRMIEGFLGADEFRSGVRAYLNKYRENNATADDFWRELATASGRDVAKIANAWIREPGHPVVHASATPAGDGLKVALRQERFFADPAAAHGTAAQRWPVPLVIKYGKGDRVETCSVLLEGEAGEVDLAGAEWFFPNAEGAGFYRFALDDGSLAALGSRLPQVLEPHERLLLANNQWALLKAGHVSIEQFLQLLGACSGDEDRAVVSTVVEQLGWIGAHVVDAGSEAAFAALVARTYGERLAALGWDAAPTETADDRMKRAAILGAMGRIARVQAVRDEARLRLEKYFADATVLDPNVVATIAAIAAIDGDAALFDRYLERKRQAGTDPEEEQRFLLALGGFEKPELIDRALTLTMTDEVRPQDRTFLFATLLGRPASRRAAWKFVRDGWDRISMTMDPMLMQGLVRATSQLTEPDMAEEVSAFLADKKTPQIQETIAQAREQLRIDAATVQRLRPALRAALS